MQLLRLSNAAPLHRREPRQNQQQDQETQLPTTSRQTRVNEVEQACQLSTSKTFD